MPYRVFVDSTATEWQVWDILPSLSERRNGEHTDRRVEIVPIKFADRRQQGRRLTESRRAVLRGNYAQGWLVFESSKEKRRLSPIPRDWTVCDEERLEAYARQGERVTGASSAFNFSDEEPFAEAG